MCVQLSGLEKKLTTTTPNTHKNNNKKKVGSPSVPVLEFLEEWTTEPLEEVAPSAVAGATKVFVNGVWVGIHREPQLLVRTLRHLRRQCDVNTEVGVVHDYGLRELRLYTDYGRTSRPLFIVDDQRLGSKKSHVRKLLAREVDAEPQPDGSVLEIEWGWNALVSVRFGFLVVFVVVVVGFLGVFGCKGGRLFAANQKQPNTY